MERGMSIAADVTTTATTKIVSATTTSTSATSVASQSMPTLSPVLSDARVVIKPAPFVSSTVTAAVNITSSDTTPSSSSAAATPTSSPSLASFSSPTEKPWTSSLSSLSSSSSSPPRATSTGVIYSSSAAATVTSSPSLASFSSSLSSSPPRATPLILTTATGVIHSSSAASAASKDSTAKEATVTTREELPPSLASSSRTTSSSSTTATAASNLTTPKEVIATTREESVASSTSLGYLSPEKPSTSVSSSSSLSSSSRATSVAATSLSSSSATKATATAGATATAATAAAAGATRGKISVQVVERTPEEITVKISGVDLSIINALRRNCIWEVDSFTMEELEMHYNTSNIDTVKLAHRLGQIPFRSELAKKYNYADECDCSNRGLTWCNKCGILYHLKVMNISDQVREVTTADLRPHDESTTVRPVAGPSLELEDADGVTRFISGDSSTEEQGDHIHICNLEPGREIDLSAIVRRGTAKRERHYKYQPVSLVGFKNPCRIIINQKHMKKLTPQQKKKIVVAATDGIFQYDEKTDHFSTTEDPNNSIRCKFNTKPIELAASYKCPDAIKFVDRTDYFLFTVATNGCLTPEQILYWSIQRLKDSLLRVHSDLINSSSL